MSVLPVGYDGVWLVSREKGVERVWGERTGVGQLGMDLVRYFLIL